MLCSLDEIKNDSMKPDVKYLNTEIICQFEGDLMIISFAIDII
jgi:hypothetical protein